MFELTYRCNFRCPHCFIQGSPGEGKELAESEVLEVLEQLRDEGVFSVSFTGGEALMRDDIFKIIEQGKKLGLRVFLLSNGSLIDKTSALKLADSGVDSVDITVNSLNAGVFNLLTGTEGLLEKASSSVKLLLEAGVFVTAKSTAMKANRGELPEIARFCRDLNVPYNLDCEVLPCRDHSAGKAEEFSLSPEDAHLAKKEVYPEMFRGKTGTPGRKRSRAWIFNCGVGYTSFSINPYGKMNFCLQIDYPGLDIRSKGVKSCWSRIKDEVDRLSSVPDFVCRDCELIDYCSWCPGRSFMETGGFNSCSDYFRERAIITRERNLKNG